MTKPMRASDAVEDKIVFPCYIQPKIDGVRGCNLIGKLTARTLKQHRNKYTTAFFSHSCTIGLDGEFAAEHHCHPDLCRITSSALSTIEGEPYTLWWLFDYITPDTKALPYRMRYAALIERVRELANYNRPIWERLRVVPTVIVHNLEELLAQEAAWLEEGYEGVIIRKIEGDYKEGYSTVREGGLLRIKRFVESEALVLEIHEGETNLNEAQINELGRQFRSTHQENMVPNGRVGFMTCQVLADVYDPTISDMPPVLRKDQIITVSAGQMPVGMREHYLQHPEEIVQQVIKFKFFPKGIKDKPRFPNYVAHRSKEDM